MIERYGAVGNTGLARIRRRAIASRAHLDALRIRQEDAILIRAAIAQLPRADARSLPPRHAWTPVELRFPAKQLARIPQHWRIFGERQSPLTENGRKGVTPINAILNYRYAVAAAEARIAVRSAGCDPGLGILHADRPGRDSLAYDVLEPVRPFVDAYVLRLAREHTFARDDFFETLQGVCRIMPPARPSFVGDRESVGKAASPNCQSCSAPI